MANSEENQETFLKIYKQLGENFKKRREKKEWTQQELCDAMKNIFPDISVTQSDVSEWEHECEYENAIVHPRAYKILCMAFTLGMHPTEIYSIKRKKEPFSQQLRECLISEDKFKETFSVNLVKEIEKKDYSNECLANLLTSKAEEMGLLKSPDDSISAKTIQRYRKGERNPPFGYLILLCKVLNVEISDFLI